MVKKTVTRGLIAAWRRKIGRITLAEGIILLRNLGNFHVDRVVIITSGYHSVTVENLSYYFSNNTLCANMRPIYFDGGPTGGKRYKGTLVTLLLDRIFLMSHEKGAAFVLREVNYARSFGPEGALKRDTTSDFTHSI